MATNVKNAAVKVGTPKVADATQSDKGPKVTKVAEAAEKKDPRRNRPQHPVAVEAAREGGAKIKEVPADYSHVKHARLLRAWFFDDGWYLGYRAAEAQHYADKFRQDAESFRKTGGASSRVAKKLLNVRAKMDELVKQLKAQGINVDELLAAQAAEPAAEASAQG